MLICLLKCRGIAVQAASRRGCNITIDWRNRFTRSRNSPVGALALLPPRQRALVHADPCRGFFCVIPSTGPGRSTPHSHGGRNPWKNDDVVDRMCSSIREFGFKIPVLARSDGTVVDGHLRLKAAKKLRMTEIPVILCDEWTEAQVKAFRLLVNRSVTWADWDAELLALELLELKESDFDLSLTASILLFGDPQTNDVRTPAHARYPQRRWLC
jgi:hypothetical protein